MGGKSWGAIGHGRASHRWLHKHWCLEGCTTQRMSRWRDLPPSGPFGFRRQLLSRPLRIGNGIHEGDVNHGVIFQAIDRALRACGMPPVRTPQVDPPICRDLPVQPADMPPAILDSSRPSCGDEDRPGRDESLATASRRSIMERSPRRSLCETVRVLQVAPEARYTPRKSGTDRLKIAMSSTREGKRHLQARRTSTDESP